MNKGLGLSAALSIGAVLGSTAASQAQTYTDLRGQIMRFTGVLAVSATVSDTVIGIDAYSTQLNETVTFEQNPQGNSGNNVYLYPEFFQFNSGTPIVNNIDTLTGTLPLPSIDVDGNNLQLPTLNLNGYYNTAGVTESVGGVTLGPGVINVTAACTCAASVTISVSGITASITLSNPSANFVGPTQAALPTPAVITGSNAKLNISASGSASLGTLHISNVSAVFTTWTMAAVPGPSALAVFMPGMLGGLAGMVSLRRPRPQ